MTCTCAQNTWDYYCEEHGGESGLFVETFNTLAKQVHSTATEKGFHDPEPSDAVMIANLHGEVSEAWEAIRHGNPPDNHIPEFSGYEAECADVIIRILDTSVTKNLRVAEAVLAKIEYNKTRPHRHGGKLF